MNPTLAFAQAAAYAVSFQYSQEMLQCEIRHAVNALAPAALALASLSKRTTWKCPFKAATYNGVPPGKHTISTWPRWAAMNKGVVPVSVVAVSMSTLASISKRRPRFDIGAAALFRSAPAAINNATTLTWPFCAAWCKGAAPRSTVARSVSDPISTLSTLIWHWSDHSRHCPFQLQQWCPKCPTFSCCVLDISLRTHFKQEQHGFHVSFFSSMMQRCIASCIPHTGIARMLKQSFESKYHCALMQQSFFYLPQFLAAKNPTQSAETTASSSWISWDQSSHQSFCRNLEMPIWAAKDCFIYLAVLPS